MFISSNQSVFLTLPSPDIIILLLNELQYVFVVPPPKKIIACYVPPFTQFPFLSQGYKLISMKNESNRRLIKMPHVGTLFSLLSHLIPSTSPSFTHSVHRVVLNSISALRLHLIFILGIMLSSMKFSNF